MAIKGKTILYLAAAILMSLPVVSCRSTSHNTHTYRPYHERRNRGTSTTDDQSATTSQEKKKPIPQQARVGPPRHQVRPERQQKTL